MPTPRDKRQRRWTIGLLAAGLVGFLTMLFILFLQEWFRRAVAVPVVQAYWRIRFFLSLLPQYLVWLVPALVMGAIILARLPRTLPPLPQGRARRTGRRRETDPLLSLAATISHARRRPFYRRTIVRELGKTAVRIIARREGLSLPEARKRFESGDWCENRAVRDLFLYARGNGGMDKVYDFERRLDEAISVLEKLEQGV